MNLVAAIAAMVGNRVVVIGSLPPGARDLDLLVRPAEAKAIAVGLEALGFERRGNVFASFGGCSAEVVDLTSAEAWGLPPAPLAALFDRARPIEPSGMICRPASGHALLMVARRVAREGPRLRAGRRERIAFEIGEDPSAFATAASQASAWGARRSLAALEGAYRGDGTLSLNQRRRALAEEFAESRARPRAALDAWRAVLKRPRKGALLALSASEPAVARRHARHLADTLDRLGFDAVVARPRARGGGAPFAVARATWPERLRGRVVICDRPIQARLALPRPTWVGVVTSDRPEELVCAELARSAWAAVS